MRERVVMNDTLCWPCRLALWSEMLFVADSGSNRVALREVDEAADSGAESGARKWTPAGEIECA
jgi:hypothetical protein